jgi:ribonuclease HI
MKKIWSMVRRISGKPTPMSTSHLKVNGMNIEHPAEIANSIASTVSHNSSSDHYSDRFRRFKAHQEQRTLDFSSDNCEPYNLPFSLSELRAALSRARDSAAGPDNVHYQMLKHLPECALQTLLGIFNNIWMSGKFPHSWSEATIIPIPKPGKDPTDPGNYRPIALTSCVCKTFERIVNDRLVWFLEKNNLLTEFQSGFRKQRNTNDHLIRFEAFIREGFVRREHVVSVFFDLEKAYDTTWKYGILRDLHKCGLRGRLPECIAHFLANRLFRVRVGSRLSDLFPQEMGVPQGSILSVTLFILKINSIVRCLPPNIKCSLYVDDFLICYRSHNMNSIERLLQLCLNGIESWADENGFQFSKTKTVCMHFCQKHTLHSDPELKIYGSSIPTVEKYKFLGLFFDKKLNFIPHIQYVKDRCMKALNLLKVVAHKDWGADCATLLKLYRSHVRSKLDYGCIVYGSARSSYLQPLDRVQNAALRVCLGAFRTSPIPSLHVEAGELPLNLRRQKLTLQYVIKLKSNPANPTHKCVFEPSFTLLFDARPFVIPPLGIRAKQHLLDSAISLDCVALSTISPVPPWLLEPPEFIYALHHSGSKSEVPPHVFQSELNAILSEIDGFTRLYTDGSKDGASVAAAAICGPRVFIKRLPNNSSVFSAEARAILLALDAMDMFNNDRFVLLTDSMSCLQSIENRKLNHPLILDIVVRIHHLISAGKRIIFLWIPSHVGIAGNTAADAAAKAALTLPECDSPIPYSDLYPGVNTYINRCWQQSWDTEVYNKLHSIEPHLKPLKLYHLPRRDELLIHRLRIGHTHLTHAYLLKRENPPECTPCQSPLTVEHILLHCIDFNLVRQKYYSVSTLTDLFNSVQPRTILNFIKEIGLYGKL